MVTDPARLGRDLSRFMRYRKFRIHSLYYL